MKKSDVNSKKLVKEAEELYTLTQKFEHIKKRFEEKKKILTTSIKNYMYANGDVNVLSFLTSDEKRMEVKKISQKRIIWNPDKMEERMDKELFNEVVEKTYTITDMEGLIHYLKSCGVNPKKFKSFISVEKKVKTDIIKQMDELGEITMEDVKGCYEVRESESYLKFVIQEEE